MNWNEQFFTICILKGQYYSCNIYTYTAYMAVVLKNNSSLSSNKNNAWYLIV